MSKVRPLLGDGPPPAEPLEETPEVVPEVPRPAKTPDTSQDSTTRMRILSLANRVVRKSWDSVNDLAEELSSAFKDLKVEVTSPLRLNVPAGQTPIKINQAQKPTDTKTKKVVELGDGNHIQIDPLGAIKASGDRTPATTASGNSSSGGGGGTPCQIVSGSGDTYTADLYASGTGAASTSTVTVTQLSIAEDETIPAGTWAIATLVGEDYYIQVPVWAEE